MIRGIVIHIWIIPRILLVIGLLPNRPIIILIDASAAASMRNTAMPRNTRASQKARYSSTRTTTILNAQGRMRATFTDTPCPASQPGHKAGFLAQECPVAVTQPLAQLPGGALLLWVVLLHNEYLAGSATGSLAYAASALKGKRQRASRVATREEAQGPKALSEKAKRLKSRSPEWSLYSRCAPTPGRRFPAFNSDNGRRQSAALHPSPNTRTDARQ